MFGVMLFLCTPCLFVCIATTSGEVTVGTCGQQQVGQQGGTVVTTGLRARGQ
jgi:hypothetical protein